MIKVELPGLTIHRYQNAKDMPAGRYHAFQKYIIEEWATGGDIHAVDSKIGILGQLIKNKETDKALRELNNLRMGFNYSLHEVNIGSYAFACSIAQIGEQKREDYSEAALKEVVEIVGKHISQKDIDEAVGALKKKLRTS